MFGKHPMWAVGRLAGAAALGLAFAAGAWAVGGHDLDPANKVNKRTQLCAKEIASKGHKYTQKRVGETKKCLAELLKCDSKANPTDATDCRKSLIEVGKGKCARGKLDSGATTLGAGASDTKNKSDKPTLDKELAKFRDAVQKKCFDAPDVDLETVANGLGFPPGPYADADRLMDVLNADPGGLGCVVNAQILQTYRIANDAAALLPPLEDVGHEAAQILKEGPGIKFCL